jgi:hypothetical protein
VENRVKILKAIQTPSNIRPHAQNATAIRTAQDMFSDNETEQGLSKFQLAYHCM